MSEPARAARLARRPGSPPTMVVAGAVDAAALRSAGWLLRGQLSAMPYDDPLDAAPYTSVDELLADPRVDAVAVDGEDPSLVPWLPELRRSGLLLLLPTPAPLDPDPVREARAVPDARPACVGLVRRWEPWAMSVAAAVPVAGAPPVQVTVRGWPRGKHAAAELVDLVAAWCGDVVGAVAAPAELPAAALPGGAPVAWSLLTASGATVLVSHEGGPMTVRVSFPTARLEATPTLVRWEDGDRLPLGLLPSWVPMTGGSPPGLVATAAALSLVVGHADVEPGEAVRLPARPGATPDSPDRGVLRPPPPADLGDLLVVARVLEALRTSARTEQLAPVA